jgi:DNA replication and repair protein RecF
MANLRQVFRPCRFYSLGNHFACRSDLIVGGSETRRKFMDSVISQLDSQYLQHLIQYQKNLNQRNALLKYFALNRVFENDTLAIYNEQLGVMVNISSIKERNSYLNLYLSLTTIPHDHRIAETVQVVYESHLFENNLLVLLQENISKDRVLHYTSVGTHKDDLSFEIDGHPIKNLVLRDNRNLFWLL